MIIKLINAILNLIFIILLCICGCSNTPNPAYFNNKLTNMINMNSQIGAIGLYNSQRFNNPFRIGDIQTNQFNWQQWYMINQKLGKYYEQ